ncbi:MAG: hypothetical protein WBI28_01420 [Candidatus Omnitrophota bacterium]
MNSDKIFFGALIISFVVHTIVLFQNSGLGFFSREKKTQDIVVNYVKPPKIQKQEQKNSPSHKISQEFLKLSSRITADNRLPPQYSTLGKENPMDKSRRAISRDSTFVKPAFIKPDIIAIKKKITLPPVDMNKISNPTYISYYQIVREKIRRAAYQNYSRTEEGESYLSFIITNQGYLKEVRFVSEKSNASQFLEEISLKSINQAAPFPVFPKELDYPQLSFNVIISFEIE